MITKYHRKHPAGWTSLLAVLTLSIFMLTFMIFAYKRAVNVHDVHANSLARTDYREKDESVLRAIVALTPNAAIGAMGDGSNSETRHFRNEFSIRNIYSNALEFSNSRESIDSELLAVVGGSDVIQANLTDSRLSLISAMFESIEDHTGFATGGLNRSFGDTFPAPLTSDTSLSDDDLYPIVTSEKYYGTSAQGLVGLSTSDYSEFNLIPYPDINFGYVTPGEDFVAKRNWWAFNMDLSGFDESETGISGFQRQFVLSIYEIPSQLPISASAFMALGEHANGDEWQDVTIEGSIFAGKAQIDGDLELSSLATRRGLDLSEGAVIGGQSFDGDPFATGLRENFRLTEGDFFPVSSASETGKAAFIPINRGAEYFDRHAHVTETSTISPTTWNEYSIGALQCAMTLDISESVSSADGTPTELTFTYIKDGFKETEVIGLQDGESTDLLRGYTFVTAENGSFTFDETVDVAYGVGERFFYKSGVTGTVRFDNATFGDPARGVRKGGYVRAASPFAAEDLSSGQHCIAFYPERLEGLLEALDADGLEVNHSIAINVDYLNSTNLDEPSIPTTDDDYGVILEECADFSAFPKGFSIVTNLRLYIGDDFNIIEGTPPDGYTPPTGEYFPPCSLFTPEKRYGVDFDPFSIELSGQVGSVASEDSDAPVRPLDATGVTGADVDSNSISINLSQISHPAELPPITMKNWLIVIEEVRAEFE